MAAEHNSLNERRTFMKSLAGAAAASLAVAPSAKAAAANERLRVGLIGCGNRMQALLKSLLDLREKGAAFDLPAISDVYRDYSQRAMDTIQQAAGTAPKSFDDYRELLSSDIDAVVIATPDHWHAKQTIDALAAGMHVYCEKPMTHTTAEAFAVLDAWKKSGRVMQVGVQSTSLPVWDHVLENVNQGRLGKVLQFQTEYFRNSITGQARFHELKAEMTPQSINWKRWLGVEEGLCPDVPFDRAIFRQWRCYKEYSGGMLTDLFVHRLTVMLKGLGLKFPGRVCAGGGIFMEYDDRENPDVASVVLDYPEGVQGLVTATMCADAARIPQLIRGHYGTLVFGNGEDHGGYDFVPERPQVTLNSKLKAERVDIGRVPNSTTAHLDNFLAAVRKGMPGLCHCPPDLGAYGVVAIQMAIRSYREGKTFFFDPKQRAVVEGDEKWAAMWEKLSRDRAKPRHIPGWTAGDCGSTLKPPAYMRLAGPWIDGQPPEG